MKVEGGPDLMVLGGRFGDLSRQLGVVVNARQQRDRAVVRPSKQQLDRTFT